MKDQFAQTSRLFSFSLKRDWLKIFAWLFGLVSLVAIGIVAYVELYSDAGEREMMAMIMTNPAMEALLGPMIGFDNYTIGAMYSHTMTIIALCLFAIMSILLVVSNTKVDEEEGILELLRSFPIGRLSHTTVSLLLLILTNVLIGGVSAAILYVFGDQSISLEGALLTGAIYGMIGIFFGAVALLMGQFTTSSRNTMMISFGLLGVSYILRTIGDSGYEWLSWLSPLGLLYRTEPFVENNWWPLFLLGFVTILVLIFAFFLQQKRDMGAGLFPEKAGKRQASSFLKTPTGLALHLLKTTLFVWTVAMLLLGVTYGSVIGDVEGLIGDNEVIEQIIGATAGMDMAEQFLGMIIGLLSIFATIPVLQTFLSLKGEETKGRTEKTLTGVYSRTNILFTFLGLSLLTSLMMQFAQLLAIGGAAAAMDFDFSMQNILKAGTAYFPAIWFSLGIVILLYGWLPKLTSVAWGYLGFAFIVLYFADFIDLPTWVQNLSVFHHTPQLPQDDFSGQVALVTTGLALGLMFLGLIGFKRRDMTD